MKRLLLLPAFFLLTAAAANAQHETLLSGPITHGGFGGPVAKMASFDGDLGLLVGGRGGWIINHVFSIGGGGYGLANNIRIPVDPANPNSYAYLDFGYGGLELEFNVQPEKLVNFSFQTLIGAGGAGYRTSMHGDDRWGTEPFFVLEPGATVNLNVTHFFRLSAGGNYRFITGSNLYGISDAGLSGPSTNVTLRFGRF